MNIKLFARAIVSNSNVSPLKIIIDIVEFSFCSNKRKSRQRNLPKKVKYYLTNNIGSKIEVSQK